MEKERCDNYDNINTHPFTFFSCLWASPSLCLILNALTPHSSLLITYPSPPPKHRKKEKKISPFYEFSQLSS